MGLISTHRHTEKLVPYEKEVTITEVKAPTDESIRLLNEMETKAEANIIHKAYVETTMYKAVVMFFRHNHIEDCITMYIKVNINGVEHEIKHTNDRHELRQDMSKYLGFGYEWAYQFFCDWLSKILAKELIKQCPEAFADFKV